MPKKRIIRWVKQEMYIQLRKQLANILISSALLLTSNSLLADSPNVVVSIQPIYSLTNEIMGNTGNPYLLLKTNTSPHHHRLKPSDIRHLSEADLIISIGGQLEIFLQPTLASLPKKNVLSLLSQTELNPYNYRATLLRGNDIQHEEKHQHSRHNKDPHIWLDPIKAKVIVTLIRDRLIQISPDNATTYLANATQLLSKLDQLHEEMLAELDPVKNVPYLVFHDAWQYLEKRYHLNALGAVTFSPEIKPGARKIRNLRRIILDKQVRCLFREPQFTPALLNIIMEDSEVSTGTLDPMGNLHSDYINMMKNNSHQLSLCLNNQMTNP